MSILCYYHVYVVCGRVGGLWAATFAVGGARRSGGTTHWSTNRPVRHRPAQLTNLHNALANRCPTLSLMQLHFKFANHQNKNRRVQPVYIIGSSWNFIQEL